MRLRDLFGADATIYSQDAAIEVRGLAVDSRAVKPGDLFFALAGHKTDGSRFIDAAVAAGAVAIASEHRPDGARVPFAVTSNARRALAKARAELQAGKSFDEVVKKHGDGPLAALGGHFDWTRPESVADANLKEALTTLKAGEVSLPIESDKACMVIKLTESQPASMPAHKSARSHDRDCAAALSTIDMESPRHARVPMTAFSSRLRRGLSGMSCNGPHRAHGPHPPAMPGNHPAHAGQPNPRAFKFFAVMQPLKSPKQAIRILRVKSDAVIANRIDHLFALHHRRTNFNFRRIARPRILQRIRNQIHEHLPQ